MVEIEKKIELVPILTYIHGSGVPKVDASSYELIYGWQLVIAAVAKV